MKHLTPQRRSASPALVVLFILLGGAGAVWFADVLQESLRKPAQAATEGTSDNAAVESMVSAIASQFSCACGSCGGESLVECTCERARKARGMIRDGVLSGRPAGHIVAAVDAAFGGRIEQPAATPEPGARKTGSMQAEVLSHFRCPCGTCGMENLAECACDHPKGGLEVRAFLDRKSAEKDYSRDELIAEVEKAYGRRKF